MIDFNTYPRCMYRQYGTGDQLWLMHDQVTEKEITVALITHDGIYWTEGMETIAHLKGWDRVKHKIQMFFFHLKKRL